MLAFLIDRVPEWAERKEVGGHFYFRLRSKELDDLAAAKKKLLRQQ